MVKTQPIAMNCALAGLFDYAGMFPPAELGLQDAVRSYQEYRRGRHSWALGCLVVRAKDLPVLHREMQTDMRSLRLSVVSADSDLETIQEHLDYGLPIETVEVKDASRAQVTALKNRLPAGVAAYFELPVELTVWDIADAIADAGMRVKLRMGGMTAEAFPKAACVALALKELSKRGLAIKATAGLHHPLRSKHPFTYREDSEDGMMHGFVNLLCAAALVWFGGAKDEVVQLLEEQDSQAWRVTADAIYWRGRHWSADEMGEVRERFLKCVGSCSFAEPVRDLEALGWL